MRERSIAIVTSIHPDFDSRIWKHAKGLAGTGYEIHLVCPWQVPSGEVCDGVRFHTFERVTRRAQRPYLIPIRLLRKLLPLLGRVQLIHFHDIDILPWMALLSFFKPVVYDVHENYPDEMMDRAWIPDLSRRLLRFGVYWAQFILSMIVRNVVLVSPSYDSGFTNRRFRKIYFRNLATLELVDGLVSDYLSRPPAAIFSGSNYVSNGTLLYLDIAEHCKEVIPGVTFYMSDRFGNETFRQQVLESIKSRALNNIELLPNVKPHELMRFLNRATFAVCPSLRVPKQIKAFRTRICEYMAAGLPIVSSDLDQDMKLISDGECGILAQPENSQSFVDALACLVRDREYAFALGKNGQKAFREKYSWESELPKLLAFYDQILET